MSAEIKNAVRRVTARDISTKPFSGLMMKRCELGSLGMFLGIYVSRTDIYRRYTCQVI